MPGMWGFPFGSKVLLERAKHYLDTYQPNLIGVVGGSGKTLVLAAIAAALEGQHLARSIAGDGSLKSIAAAILGTKRPAKKSWFKLLTGSFLKEIVEPEPDTIVLELNAHQPGDIDTLSRQLPFTQALILNVQTLHADLFPAKGMVAHEFMSLPASLPKSGVAILNIDDPFVAGMREHLFCQQLTFGEHPDADIRLSRAERISIQGFIGQISVLGQAYEFTVQYLVGRHQLYAILAALAVVVAMGGNVQKALHNLKGIKLPAGRMQIIKGKHNSVIINDSHDATFESMQAALKTLAALPGDLPRSKEITPRRIAILGDIAYLGKETTKAHEQIGTLAAETCDVLIAVGEYMKHAQAAALKKGGVDTHHFNQTQDVSKWLRGYLQAGDIVLIKGSKVMHMENLASELKEV